MIDPCPPCFVTSLHEAMEGATSIVRVLVPDLTCYSNCDKTFTQ